MLACPPAPRLAASCAQRLARRLQRAQQQQQATGRAAVDLGLVARALEECLVGGDVTRMQAAARAAADAGAVRALLQLAGPQGAVAGRAPALSALRWLVNGGGETVADEVAAAGGIEAALAPLQGPRQQQPEAAAATAAVHLLAAMAIQERQEVRRRLLAAGGLAPMVRQFLRCKAEQQEERWAKQAACSIARLLVHSKAGGPGPELCSAEQAEQAIWAGAVPLMLRCLAHPCGAAGLQELVHHDACCALGSLAQALLASTGLASGGGLPERLVAALRPAVGGLCAVLRATQLPVVAAAAMGALADIVLADCALQREVLAAGAAQLAAEWAGKPVGQVEVQGELQQSAAVLLRNVHHVGDAILGCLQSGGVSGSRAYRPACPPERRSG
jgi:hypothetical protein